MNLTGYDPRLGALLRRLRRRHRAVAMARVLLVALAVFLVTLFAAALVDRFGFLDEDDRQTLAVVVVSATMVGAALAALLWLRPLGFRGLARLTESACPDRRELILSAVEFDAGRPHGAEESAAFRLELQRQAGERAARIDVGHVVPYARLRVAAVAAVGALVLNGAAALVPGMGYLQVVERILDPHGDLQRVTSTHVEILPGDVTIPQGRDLVITAVVDGTPARTAAIHWHTGAPGAGFLALSAVVGAMPSGVLSMVSGDPSEDGRRRFSARLEGVRGPLFALVRAGDGESRRIRIDTAPPPGAEGFVKVYHRPAYLDTRSRAVQEEHGNLRALAGSRVDLIVRTSQALRSARIAASFQDGSTREIELAVDGREARLEKLHLDMPGTYRFRCAAAATGFSSEWSREYAIEIVPDAEPWIILERPTTTLRVGAGSMIERLVRAGDDHGVASVVESVVVNDGKPVTRSLAMEERHGEVRCTGGLDLGALGVVAGDRLRVDHRVTDRLGQVVIATPVIVTVVASGAELIESRFLATYREVVQRLQALSGSGLDIGTRWRDTEACLRLIEDALGRSPDPETERDLLLIHAGLTTVRDGWHVGEAPRLVTAARALLDEYELHRALRRRLIVLHERLARLVVLGEQALLDPEPGADRHLRRERHALANELRALLDAFWREHGPGAGPARAAWGVLGGPLEGLEAALIDIESLRDLQGWSLLATEVDDFLKKADRPVRKLWLGGPATRALIRELATTESAAMKNVAAAGEVMAAAWRSVLRRADTAPAGVLAGDLQSILGTLQEARRTADPRAVDATFTLRLPALARGLAGRARAIAAAPETDRRFLADLALLDLVLDVLDRRQRREERGKWVDAVSADDESGVRELVSGLLAAEVIAVPLARASRLFVALEISHELGLVVRLARTITERHRDTPQPGGRRFRDLAERFRVFHWEFLRVVDAARWGAPELAASLEALQSSADVVAMERYHDGKGPADAAEHARAVARLGRIVKQLEKLHADETPDIRVCRVELRRMAPQHALELAALIDAARVARQGSRDTLAHWQGKEGDDVALSNEQHDALIAVELTARDGSARLRASLVREANAMDLTGVREQKLARFCDVAIRALREPDPAAADLLFTVPGLVGEDRRERMVEVEAQQSRRVGVLENLRAPLETLEAGDLDRALESISELQKGPDMESAVESLHGPLAEFTRLRDEQRRLAVASAAAATEREDSDPTGESSRLATDQDRVADSLARVILAAEYGPDLLDRRLEELVARARQELGEQVSRQGTLNSRFAVRFTEVTSRRDAIAAAVTGLVKETRELVESGLARLRGVARERNRPEINAPLAMAMDRLSRALESLRHSMRSAGRSGPESGRHLEGGSASLREAARQIDRARALAAGGSGRPAVELWIDALEQIDALGRRGRRLATVEAERTSAWAEDDARFLARRRRVLAEGLREELRALEDRRSEAEERRSVKRRTLRAHWLELADGAEEEATKIRDRLAVSGRARSDRFAAEKILVDRLRHAAVELGWIAREFESLPVRALDRLDRLAGNLASSASDSAGSTLHLEIAAALERTMRVASGAEDLVLRLETSRRESSSGMDDMRASEESLLEAVGDTSGLLGRIIVHAGRRGSGWLEPAVRSRRWIDEGAVPSLEELVHELAAVQTVKVDESFAGTRVEAAIRGAREELTVGTRQTASRSGSGTGETPALAAAGASVDALQSMTAAAVALRAGHPDRATVSQRRAVTELERAIRAIGRAISQRRSELESSAPGRLERSPDARSDSATSSQRQSDTKAPASGESAAAREGAWLLLPDIGPGGEDRWFVTLPAELKREILQSSRERIPAGFRERVEAYFRAVAEKSSETSP